MRNGSHTTTLCKNDRSESVEKYLKRRSNQEGFTVHLMSLERNYFLRVASICPNTKLGFLLSTIEALKLEYDQKWPELANRRGVVFHQDDPRPHTCL
ncbi:hypothetical protein TNCV_2455201 [Trichonephila clavipes]|nr:hypothetical protein TNCV_2455201 [Trichonephila clavipes]